MWCLRCRQRCRDSALVRHPKPRTVFDKPRLSPAREGSSPSPYISRMRSTLCAVGRPITLLEKHVGVEAERGIKEHVAPCDDQKVITNASGLKLLPDPMARFIEPVDSSLDRSIRPYLGRCVLATLITGRAFRAR